LKLKELLRESTQDDDITQKLVIEITTKCQPFLKEIHYQVSNECLYRGIGYIPFSLTNDSGNFRVIAGYSNRKPVDTPQYIHDEANHIFTKLFKYPFRNGTFVTGSYDTASNYGHVGIVLPIGDFHYLWSNYVEDLFNSWEEFNGEHNTEDNKQDNFEANQMAFLDELELNKKHYQSSNLLAAIQTGNEIMLYCDHYLILPTKNINVTNALRQIQKNHGANI